MTGMTASSAPLIGSDHQDDDTNDGGDNTMPEWVSNTNYSVSDNSNVDGNADTVMFPVVAADYDAAKFFIWNGQDVQSIYKSDGSYFEEADFTAGVDASQIYVSNYVEAELDVYSITSGGIEDIVGSSGLTDLINQGYNNGATFATQIGEDLQLLGYGTGYFPQYAPQPVTGIDLGGNPESEKYLTQVKDGYVLYSSTFGSNEDDGDGDAAGVGDGDAGYVYDGDLTYGNIQIPQRFSTWESTNLYAISEADQTALLGSVSIPEADGSIFHLYQEYDDGGDGGDWYVQAVEFAETDEQGDSVYREVDAQPVMLTTSDPSVSLIAQIALHFGWGILATAIFQCLKIMRTTYLR